MACGAASLRIGWPTSCTPGARWASNGSCTPATTLRAATPTTSALELSRTTSRTCAPRSVTAILLHSVARRTTTRGLLQTMYVRSDGCRQTGGPGVRSRRGSHARWTTSEGSFGATHGGTWHERRRAARPQAPQRSHPGSQQRLSRPRLAAGVSVRRLTGRATREAACPRGLSGSCRCTRGSSRRSARCGSGPYPSRPPPPPQRQAPYRPTCTRHIGDTTPWS